MKYKISIKAKEDMQDIWLYTFDEWSLNQAGQYINGLILAFEKITRKPFSGKNYKSVREGYYRLQFKSHFIFYKINKAEECIEIIRILHQRMDIENRLSK